MTTDPRIGVVGAGIAGASLAHFVKEHIDREFEIVVFEQDDRVGGRIRDVAVGGETVETGAKFVLPWNQHLTGFIDHFDLPTRDADELTDQRIGIWDGSSLTFETSQWDWLTAVKMLWRYGFGIRRLQPAIDDIVERIGRIYEPPLVSTGFHSAAELLEALDLDHLTERTGHEHFENLGVPDSFVREFVDGAARSIYAQDAALNAFASLIVMSAVGGSKQPFAVDGGNAQVCQHLLESAAAEVRLETAVNRISTQSTGDGPTYDIETEQGTGERFDAVCLATPLEVSDIEFENVDLPDNVADRRYVTLHVSIVVGRLDPAYFDCHTAGDIPGFVLTKAGTDDPFMFLLKRGETADGTAAIYQLWSRTAGDDERLTDVFAQIDDHRTVTWDAFPELSPGVSMPPFRFAHGLYYVNAAESIASAMEAEAIGSRNVANLLASDLAEDPPSTTDPAA